MRKYRGNPWAVLMVVSLGFFMTLLDRNYTVVNWVSGVLAIGMMGIFLPFTIYLQSVLGFSALKAWLTMAPASLVSMFVAPVAGRMTDRIGGKYILCPA